MLVGESDRIAEFWTAFYAMIHGVGCNSSLPPNRVGLDVSVFI